MIILNHKYVYLLLKINIYIDNTPQSARTYATLIIEPQIDNDKQIQLV